MKFVFTVISLLCISVLASEAKKNQLHPFCLTVKDQLSNDLKNHQMIQLKNSSIDLILVSKKYRKVFLYQKGQVQYVFNATFGQNYSKGPKIELGDKKTPEGLYSVEYKNDQSEFYKALKVSYPNSEDKAYAIQNGLVPGDDIMIHGYKKNYAQLIENNNAWSQAEAFNWTSGCVAVRNNVMDLLFKIIKTKTQIAMCPL